MSFKFAFEKFVNLIFKIVLPIIENKITVSLTYMIRRAIWNTRLNSLGSDTVLYPNIVIHNPGRVAIGNDCAIAEFVHIWGGAGVTIGDNVIIASHVAITSTTHSPKENVIKDSVIKKPVVIEKNVWIGTHAIILPGVTIGSGSVVAAGAVVNKDVPRNVIVAGVPAKVKSHIERNSI